jgi:hypothetical protein
MSMKMRWSLVLSASFVATTALAQPKEPKADAPKAPAPPVMTVAPMGKLPVVDLGAKRVTAFNTALARAGLGSAVFQVPPPPAYAKLTPSAPTTNGAKITRAGMMSFVAYADNAPDGFYTFDAVAPPSVGPNMFAGFEEAQRVFGPPVPKGTMAIEFSAESNKLYVVDCRIASSSPLPGASVGAVTFGRSGATATQDVAADDGHVLYAFRSGTGILLRQTVNLAFKSPTTFFGCEITKS